MGDQVVTYEHHVSVDVSVLVDHPKSALLPVLKLLRGGWETAIEDDVTVEQFSGAMTNMVYRCGLQQHGQEAQVVLMRVHASSSDLFDRQAEIDTFRGVSKAGLGPRLLLLFSNGRVEEFLSQHVTLAAADIHDPAVSAAIATTLATFHARMSKALSGSKHHQGLVQLWDRLRQWLELVQQVTTAPELQLLGMANLEQEITQLEQQLSCQHPCWVALCHNDLQYGNIMALASAAELIGSTAPADLVDACAHSGANNGNSTSNLLASQLDAMGLGHAQHKQQQQHQTRQAGYDDAASLSNVSQAGSTAPSVSGLSVLSGSGTPAAALADGSGSRAAGVPAGCMPAAKDPRMASLASSASGSSLQLLGRSPNMTVQLPDGSLVLPGMKARPRGQSPEPARGKRPGGTSSGGSFTGGSFSCEAALGNPGMQPPGGSTSCDQAARAGSGGGGIDAVPRASAEAAAANAAASRGVGGAELAVMMQTPSARAVRRHTHGSDEGEKLLLVLGHDAAEAAVDASLRRRRVSKPSAAMDSDGSYSDSDSSAADSADADDLVLPQLLSAQQRQQQRRTAAAGGSGSRRVAAAVEARAGRGAGIGLVGVVADQDAARSRTARRFQELRKARKTPAAGLEFPTLITSDASDDYIGASNSSGLSDDDSDDSTRRRSGTMSGGRYGRAAAGPPRGRSPGSRSPVQAAGAAAGPPVRGGGSPIPGAAAGAGRGGAGGAAGAAARLPAAAAKAAPAAAASPNQPQQPVRVSDGNIEAEPAGCLTFIDYEYSGFNPIAFDIANHWCEWAADYHTESPHVLDFSRLPDLQQQRMFVEAYLRALLTRLGVQLPPEADSQPASAAAAAGTGSGSGSTPSRPVDRLSGAGGVGGADGSSRWSAMTSRGGSLLSMPDTEAGWETASQSSVVTSRSARTDAALHDVDEDGSFTGEQQLHEGLAGGGGSIALHGADMKPCTAQLRDVWYWLELATAAPAGPGSAGGSSSAQLDMPAWQQLVQGLVAAAQAYMAASHLQWALWGVIQSKVSDVDFDFTGYGQQRWQQYLQTRPAAGRQQQQ